MGKKAKTRTFPRSIKTSREVLGERNVRIKFSTSPKKNLVLKVKLDGAFNALGNAKSLETANYLATVSKPLRAKRRMRHIAQRARLCLDKAKEHPRESTPPTLVNERGPRVRHMRGHTREGQNPQLPHKL